LSDRDERLTLFGPASTAQLDARFRPAQTHQTAWSFDRGLVSSVARGLVAIFFLRPGLDAVWEADGIVRKWAMGSGFVIWAVLSK
jgi:hypothetical protein